MESIDFYSTENEAFNRIEAAMFKAISSGKTKFSESGYSVILSNPVSGRHDLSNDVNRALLQMKAAGISIDDVSDADITAYKAWFEPMYRARQIERARILITDKFACEFSRRELEPANEVRLIDGWGDVVINRVIRCKQGRPDMEKIHSVIDGMLVDYPEYAEATVQNNNRAAV